MLKNIQAITHLNYIVQAKAIKHYNIAPHAQ